MDKLIGILLSPKLWISIAIICGAIVCRFLLKKYVNKHLSKDSVFGKKEINIRYIAVLIKYLIVIFAVVLVLQVNGINVSSLVAGLGIAGIIVGFALQDLLKDLIMGTNIVWDDFFVVGDVVKYNNIIGEVIYFNIKVTRIYDINTGNIITISNRNISDIEKVSDWLDVLIPASYEVKAEKMRRVCEEISDIIEENQDVKSCDFLGTDEFCDSQINYKIRVHCNPRLKAPVKRYCLGVIQDILDKEGLEIPYPKMDVTIMKNDNIKII